MKSAVAILSSIVLLLSAAVGWLVFDRIEQRRDFDSLVSHFNALEEGVVMQATIDNLSQELNASSSKLSRAIGILGDQADGIDDLDTRMKAVFSGHDDLVSAHRTILERVKEIEDCVGDVSGDRITIRRSASTLLERVENLERALDDATAAARRREAFSR